MKKLLALILAAALALTLAACGKSEAAKAVDDQISAIGEVTLDSEDAITAAEAAVGALEEEDREQLDNLDALSQARTDYEALVLQAEADGIEELISAIGTVTLDSGGAIEAAEEVYDSASPEVQALVENAAVLEEARAALLEAQADEVEAAISAIGTVTLDSGEAIDAAGEAYGSAPPEVQALVENAADLEKAETALSGLRVAQTEELIAAIGAVTADSGESISAARSAYQALSSEDQAKITNLETLEQAESAFSAARQAAAESLLSGTWRVQDRVQGVTFYHPANIPHGSEYWYYDQRSFVLPYLVREDQSGRVGMNLIYCYTGSDWVFFEDIIVMADGERFTDSFRYYDVDRNVSGGRVCETAESSVEYDGYNYKMLRAIADSAETIVRFQGDDRYRDITVSAADKSAIRTMLDAFDAFQGL